MSNTTFICLVRGMPPHGFFFNQIIERFKMKVQQNPVPPLSYSDPGLQGCCDGHFDASPRSPSKEGLAVLVAGSTMGRQAAAVNPFKKCLSGREPPCSRALICSDTSHPWHIDEAWANLIPLWMTLVQKAILAPELLLCLVKAVCHRASISARLPPLHIPASFPSTEKALVKLREAESRMLVARDQEREKWGVAHQQG